MKKYICIVIIVFLANMSAHAAEYVVDKAASNIEFSGTHAGKAFKGNFGAWDAAIQFDSANLAASSLKVTIDPASAKTGDAMYDGTLPTIDWFDVANHPQASFVSESISKKDDSSYSAKGALTIRGKAVPVAFDFALTDLAAPPVKTSFTLTLDRLAHDIGIKSDAKAEWVSKDITINVTLAASPK